MSEATERESRYEVTLNGISMASLSPEIVITDVQYEEPQYERQTYAVAKRQGARIISEYKERAAVSITFMIRSYPIEDRQEICQEIIRWARDGGDLRINDREGQKLVCICEQLPAITSVRGWTEELYITFAAYDIPYWQAVTPTVYTGSFPGGESVGGDEGYTEISMTIPGSAPKAYLEFVLDFYEEYKNDVEFINPADPEHSFKIMGGYGDPTGGTSRKLSVKRDANEVQRAFQTFVVTADQTTYDRDITWCIKGTDELTAPCGKTTTFKFRYGQLASDGAFFIPYACNLTITARGLWE